MYSNQENSSSWDALRLAYIATAVGVSLSYFLKYDPKDVIIVITVSFWTYRFIFGGLDCLFAEMLTISENRC